MKRILLAFLLLASSSAHAHDVWADGSAVPAWIKSSCCGPADAHMLRPDQVQRISDDYYQIDGYNARVPAKVALPSQDGHYWIFYATNPQTGAQSTVYCFFVPMDF